MSDRPSPTATSPGSSAAVTAGSCRRGAPWAATVLVLLLGVAAAGCGSGAAIRSGTATTTTTTSVFVAGSLWRGNFGPTPLPVPVNLLRAVSCATGKDCWAVGSTVGVSGAPNGPALIATADGGATWSGLPVPPMAGFLSSISCSDRTYCVAVGQTSGGQAAIIEMSSGSGTWTDVAVPPGVLDLTAVYCVSDRHCMAAGRTGAAVVSLASVSPGAWSVAGATPASFTVATGLSCTSDTDCWLVGQHATDADHVTGEVAVTGTAGATWSESAPLTGAGALDGISCQSGGALPVTAPSRTAPSSTPPSSTPPSSAPPSSAPPSTSTTVPAGVGGARCTVVGTTATTLDGARSGHGLIFTTDGGGAVWSAVTVPGTAAAFTGVSCLRPDTCMAVGSSPTTAGAGGVVLATGGSGQPWARGTALALPQPLSGISCASTSACLLVGGSISEHLTGGHS